MNNQKNDSEEEKQYILELVRQGFHYKEIGQKLGYARTTVYNKFKRYGIPAFPPYKDLTGKRFSKLFVVRVDGHKSYGHVSWLCKCDCGKETHVTSNHLNRGVTKSCGCGRYKHTRYGDMSTAYMQMIAKGAADRGIEFKITIEQAWDLFIRQDKKCAISGLPIDIKFKWAQYNSLSASLDRIDSNKGYTIDNVQWVHKMVNLMKHAHSMDQFLYMVGKIYENNIDKIKSLGDITISNSMWTKRKGRKNVGHRRKPNR